MMWRENTDHVVSFHVNTPWGRWIFFTNLLPLASPNVLTSAGWSRQSIHRSTCGYWQRFLWITSRYGKLPSVLDGRRLDFNIIIKKKKQSVTENIRLTRPPLCQFSSWAEPRCLWAKNRCCSNVRTSLLSSCISTCLLIMFLLTMCLRSAGSFWISSNSLIFSGSKSSCSSHVASSYERLHHFTR